MPRTKPPCPAEFRQRSLNFEKIAAKTGLADMYVFYRQLSADAAHPSHEALVRDICQDYTVLSK